jgi:hypothetical protein
VVLALVAEVLHAEPTPLLRHAAAHASTARPSAASIPTSAAHSVLAERTSPAALAHVHGRLLNHPLPSRSRSRPPVHVSQQPSAAPRRSSGKLPRAAARRWPDAWKRRHVVANSHAERRTRYAAWRGASKRRRRERGGAGTSSSTTPTTRCGGRRSAHHGWRGTRG